MVKRGDPLAYASRLCCLLSRQYCLSSRLYSLLSMLMNNSRLSLRTQQSMQIVSSIQSRYLSPGRTPCHALLVWEFKSLGRFCKNDRAGNRTHAYRYHAQNAQCRSRAIVCCLYPQHALVNSHGCSCRCCYCCCCGGGGGGGGSAETARVAAAVHRAYASLNFYLKSTKLPFFLSFAASTDPADTTRAVP